MFLQAHDRDDISRTGEQALRDGASTLDRRDAGNPVAGRCPADQCSVAAGPAASRRVDDQVDRPVLDQPYRVVWTVTDLVDVGRR